MSSASHSAHGHLDHGHDDGRVHVHVAPVPFYVGIFLALISLTFLTVAVSYFDFGPANAIIAVLIATMKASLVAAFFMHLNHDKVFHTIVFLASFLFLLVFVFFTAEDVTRRGDVDPAYGCESLSGVRCHMERDGNDPTGDQASGGLSAVQAPSGGETHETKSKAEEKAHH